MAEAAHNVDGEFWQPPMASAETASTPVVVSSGAAEACEYCGTEFMVGANFCHTCGATRPVFGVEQPWALRSLGRHLEFQTIKARLGLPTASLIFFLIGVICALSAIAVGF